MNFLLLIIVNIKYFLRKNINTILINSQTVVVIKKIIKRYFSYEIIYVLI